MIETFTKQDFETCLQSHSPFQSLGLIDGEETYMLPLDNQVSITIRSSIKSNDLSADVGKDSIRIWLVNGDKPLGSKVSKWTTRQAGWEDRLGKNIDTLVLWRALAGDCKECDKPKGIFKAKTEKNKGRPFARCKDHKDSFVWLDEPIKKSDIYFSEESRKKYPELEKFNWWHNQEVSEESEVSKNDTGEIPQSKKGDVALDNKKEDDTLPHSSVAIVQRDMVSKLQCNSLQELPSGPNPAQQSAIEASINSDLRVLAGPGSGKSFTIKHRCKFLLENGVKPENILVVTFSKQMANEAGKLIKEICPDIMLDLVSTIHACCYRLLAKWYPDSRWYKWQVPKDWQVKKTLEEAIGIVWQEKEKPSAQEVFQWINSSKYCSLTVDDSYEYFVIQLGSQYGEWLYDIRSKFDAWLNRNRFMTFADQLYLVEKRLQNDEAWRSVLQSRFSHVIVDEGQDTNFQAMRILITLSLESGQNTVYESEVR